MYCQSCNEEIDMKNTLGIKGGYLSTEGEVFCSDVRCLKKALNKNEGLSFEYRTWNELKEDIKSGKLIHSSQLEKSL